MFTRQTKFVIEDGSHEVFADRADKEDATSC